MKNPITKLIILYLLIVLTILLMAVLIARAAVRSRLEYKREFVHSLFLQNPNSKQRPEYLLGVSLEIAWYNAWLWQVQSLNETFLDVAIPDEVMDETRYRP